MQIGKYWGITFHSRTYEFDYNRQNVKSENYFSGASDGGSASGSGYSTKDLGSRIRGRYSHAFPAIYIGAEGEDRAGFLDEVAKSQLLFGADPTFDPLKTYFLANLNQGNNLELLGVYLVGKGDVRVPNFNLVTILQLQYLNNTRNYTPLELFTFQLQVTSPLYYSGINRFRFSFIDLSIQIPIEF